MKIVDIRQKTFPLSAPMRNAGISYGEMTASVVAVVTDARRGGRPLVGLGFDSIGRYGHGLLLAERFAPRLQAADPAALLEPSSGAIDPVAAWDVAMANEKPGGHGERAGAVGLLDAALWDLAAKAAEVPLWRLLADRFNGGQFLDSVPAYASGGHYREGGLAALRDEVAGWRGMGHTHAKIKIGGGSLEEDKRRIETAREAIGADGRLAVDGNGAFGYDTALAYLRLAETFGLAWVEEPASPLDFDRHAALAAASPAPIGTGENIFSAADTVNLLRHGGLRPDTDLLQMDISLSYGIPEYLRIIGAAEAAGWPRSAFVPHAGHLFALHAVAGLGLGRYESAPDPAEIFGGFQSDVRVEAGAVTLPQTPGVGIETKDNLYAVFADLLP